MLEGELYWIESGLTELQPSRDPARSPGDPLELFTLSDASDGESARFAGIGGWLS